VSGYDVLLFFHVLAAFTTVTVVVLLTTFAIATRSGAAAEALPVLQLSGLARRLWDFSGLGTLAFGIALAIDVDGYSLLDGWILTALVLWIVAAGTGTRVGQAFQEAREMAERGEGDLTTLVRGTRTLHVVMAVAVAALLVVMIYKPGA
jgi:uncharacterized membrane protein